MRRLRSAADAAPFVDRVACFVEAFVVASTGSLDWVLVIERGELIILRDPQQLRRIMQFVACIVVRKSGIKPSGDRGCLHNGLSPLLLYSGPKVEWRAEWRAKIFPLPSLTVGMLWRRLHPDYLALCWSLDRPGMEYG